MEELRVESGWEEICERSDCGDLYVSDSDRLIDSCMVSMSDADMQKLVEELDKKDIAVYLKVMKGTAAKKLHDSLTKHKRDEIIENYKHLDPVRMVDIERSSEVILKKIQKLEDEGEIHIDLV